MRDYDDILHLPHPVSSTRRRMTAEERAAQFAPFAALTGFGAVIVETARTTDARIELDEYGRERLDARLRTLQEALADEPVVTVTYFVPDERKEGGAYVTVQGAVKKLDVYERQIVFTDGRAVSFDDLYALDGAVFDDMGGKCDAETGALPPL